MVASLPTLMLAVTIPTVPVGDANNADDIHGDGYGGVTYDFRIAITEVTNAQYAEFLNAKAASDLLSLYHTNMGNSARGGITRDGSFGSYTYAVKANMGDKPVNFVSWYSAARFANWLHNGQGVGDTESGAYTLLGAAAIPTNGLSINRNSGARWFLPSEDEWYKAAYYDPFLAGGSYWNYPTRSDSTPTTATADADGDISNPGSNVANYSSDAIWNGQTGNVTTVGSAGSSSVSYYQTFDQAGNVWEWNESLIEDRRGVRGGSYNNAAISLAAASRGSADPEITDAAHGFRVATLVPEPSTGFLVVVGIAILHSRRASRKL